MTNTYLDVTYNNVNELNGWQYDGVSQLTCAQTGLYLLTFMGKVRLVNGGTVSMHATKNGTILPGAQTDVVISGNFLYNMAQTCLARFEAGDTLKVQWAETTLTADLSRFQVNPGEGLSASLTVTRVA